jgi:anti-sigma factor RsiW
MLGAYEDGEMGGTEQREVARHLAGCASCTTEMAATSALGAQLRATAIQPDLTGFTSTVLERIADLTPPLHVRISRYFESVREQLSTAFAFGAAGLAVAALTAVLIAPYASRFIGHGSPTQVAIVVSPDAAPAPAAVEFVENEVSPAIVTPAMEPRTVIASLDSHIPSVAVWSAPESATSVLWVPDQR